MACVRSDRRRHRSVLPDLAPVAIFAFRRPDHLDRTLTALAANTLASRSAVVAFADGPRQSDDLPGIRAVRKVLEDWQLRGAFSSLSIERAESNRGLANSIIAGVTRMVAKSGRVIVVEDDLVTSPAFLEFMNTGLDAYADNERVASIHGYCYPTVTALPPAFFLRGADCWGWATWSRAWAVFEPDGATLLRRLHDRHLDAAFDHDNARDLITMLERQISGRNDSWAIRWHASAFLADMLTLYPGCSLVHNIGNDATGTHCDEADMFDARLAQTAPTVDVPVIESATARQMLGEWFRANTSLRSRLGMTLRRLRRHLPSGAA